MAVPHVQLSGIAKSFGGVQALKGVDLAVELGRTHALLGENGAGKSTLIRILTGALVPDAGAIVIGGAVRRFRYPEEAQAAGIAAVYQEPAIYPHLSVLENIFAGREICGRFGLIRKAAMAAAVRPWLERLELSPELLTRQMSRLSLGYQQLVLIAKALTQDAKVLIFDEPTSILSKAETDRLFAIINRLRADGRGIVYITHRLDEIPAIADQVTVLTDGQVTGAAPIGELDEAKLLALMAGSASRDYAEPLRHRTRPAARPVLEIIGLSSKGLYRDVRWSAPGGVVTGIYGLVGSGRSEVALAAFGALKPDAGEIRLEGKLIAPADPAAAISLGIGYLPEDRKLQGIFASKPLEANLTVNALPRFAGRAARLDFVALRTEAARLMRSFSIKGESPATPIGTLSGGNQQKALFARWAGRALKVLILDEPTRGIDIGTKAEIHHFIRELAASGLAMVVISSDLPEILAVSDTVLVMRNGVVAAEASGEAMNAEAILAAAIGAKDAAREAA